MTLRPLENRLEILLGNAEARRAEQGYPLVFQALQKADHRRGAVSFIGPKADE